jgi:hypothetical protein
MGQTSGQKIFPLLNRYAGFRLVAYDGDGMDAARHIRSAQQKGQIQKPGGGIEIGYGHHDPLFTSGLDDAIRRPGRHPPAVTIHHPCPQGAGDKNHGNGAVEY